MVPGLLCGFFLLCIAIMAIMAIMAYLPRQNMTFKGVRQDMTPDDLRLYGSLRELIKDYRHWRKLSQEAFADLIRISLRELQRWESGNGHARIGSLHDLSEVTGIPMQVCVALNSEQPIWYSLRKRRLAYSTMEEARFSSEELSKYRAHAENRVLVKCERIATEKQIGKVLSCHQDIYGAATPLRLEVMKAAIMSLPELNRIAFDSWGHYVGHTVCLPIATATYHQVKKQKVLEDHLTTAIISDIFAFNEGVFFFYSSFATDLNVAYQLVIDQVRYFAKKEQKESYLLVFHVAMAEAKTFFSHLGMKRVKDYEPAHADVMPKIYEIRLDILLRPEGPWGWLVRGDKNIPLSVAGVPLCVDNSTPANVAEPGTSSGESKAQACRNPACSLFGKQGQDNIIANGTYLTKNGNPSQRFRCKACGKSFSQRAGSIYYGRRAPETKILMALELLLTGMPLRAVAQVIKVKPNTVGSWLKVAFKERETLDALLLSQRRADQAALDTLWAAVGKNSLRRRAALWKGASKPAATL